MRELGSRKKFGTLVEIGFQSHSSTRAEQCLKVIMVGCDLHQRTMVLRFCAGSEQPESRTFENTTCGRARMVSFLRNYKRARRSSRIALVSFWAGARYFRGAKGDSK
jgi:hypothetical protein